MSLVVRTLGLFLMLGLLLPVMSSAQDKKDVADDKKDEVKKDEPKKEEKKDDDPEKKKEPKKVEPEEKLVYGHMVTAKIKRIDANSNRDFTIEMPMIDPMKQYNLQVWSAQQMAEISRAKFNERGQKINQYQQQYAQKQKDLIVMKDYDLRGSADIKVRSMYPPVDYDDRGFLKKYTPKELAALKGNSKLPGFPSAIENLRAGQYVQVYMAKQAAQPKVPQKKRLLDEGDIPAPSDRPEAVMIVITQEVGPGR